MDALNPIRNIASVAHPSDDLLGKDEAMLVIDGAGHYCIILMQNLASQ